LLRPRNAPRASDPSPPGARPSPPLTYRPAPDIAYSILLRGAGVRLLWDSILATAALGAALFALGLVRFRRQFG